MISISSPLNLVLEALNSLVGTSSFMILVNYLKKVKCYKQKILEPLLILLSPFAPFICEEIWHKLKKSHTSISYSKFPIYDDSILTTNNIN